jgi:sugar/nucleoside kinase (ribokinase family)
MSPTRPSPEIVVVGHLSRDLLISPEITRESLGGGTAYAMLAPAVGAKGAGIVTCVGQDFQQEYVDILRKSGLDLTGLRKRGPHSTRFVNIYDSAGNRTQRVEAVAPRLTGKDYAEHHLRSKVIHFCPLTAAELDFSCLEKADAGGAFVSLDVQGYLRAIDGDQVVPREWEERDDILGYVDLLKFDSQELKIAYGDIPKASAVERITKLGPRIVIVTRDRRGSIVFTRDSRIDIPLVLADKFVDATGCGDTYVIGFLLEYMRTGEVWQSGLFGASCASHNLESVGPYNMPTRKQVEQRMKPYLRS